MTFYFNVPDMDCGGCVRSITEAIHQLDARATVDANVESKKVCISGNADAKTYAQAIEEAGFSVIAAN